MSTISDDKKQKAYAAIRRLRSRAEDTLHDPGIDLGKNQGKDFQTLADQSGMPAEKKFKKKKKQKKGWEEGETGKEQMHRQSIHQFFNEEEKDIVLLHVPDRFSNNSRFNAGNIWGKERQLFNRAKPGLKNILINKTIENGEVVTLTDIVLVVRKDIFDNFLAKASENIKKRYDEGQEEINFLKSWAGKDIVSKHQMCEDASDRVWKGYRFKFESIPVEAGVLDTQTVGVVCKKNVFIPDHRDEILADITCYMDGLEIKDHFYKGQLNFLIGPGHFDNLQVKDMPRELCIGLWYDNETDRFAFDHRPVDPNKAMAAEGFDNPGGLLAVVDNRHWYLFKDETKDSADILIKMVDKEGKEKDLLSVHLNQRIMADKSFEEPVGDRIEDYGDTIPVTPPDRQEAEETGNVYEADDQTIPVRPPDRENRAVSFLTRTHRLMPEFDEKFAPEGVDCFSACFGGQGDWVAGDDDRAKVKVTWNKSDIIFKSLDNQLLLDGASFNRGETFQWAADQEALEIYGSNDNFYIHFDRNGVPLFSDPDEGDPGNAFSIHMAVINTKPDLEFPIKNVNNLVLIGRGDGCNINTSFVAGKDKELEQQFAFNRMGSCRFHAVFDPLHKIVWNISTQQAPVFIYEQQNGTFNQLKAVKPFLQKELCDSCQQMDAQIRTAIKDRTLSSGKIRKMIFGSSTAPGFVNCSICAEKRDFACIEPGEYIAVGNAVYQYTSPDQG